MTEDATLSEFGVGAGDEDGADAETDGDELDEGRSIDDRDAPRSSSESGAASASESESGTATEARSDRPDPSLSTYAWGDYACSRCGAKTERVWRDGDAFVCSACKEW